MIVSVAKLLPGAYPCSTSRQGAGSGSHWAKRKTAGCCGDGSAGSATSALDTVAKPRGMLNRIVVSAEAPTAGLSSDSRASHVPQPPSASGAGAALNGI